MLLFYVAYDSIIIPVYTDFRKSYNVHLLYYFNEKRDIMDNIRCPGCMNVIIADSVCPVCGYDLSEKNASHQLPAGTVLNGHYIVGKVLGQGGFGITYLGWDDQLNIPIAIKEYYPTGLVMRDNVHSLRVTDCTGDSTGFRNNLARFVREAQALARLRHVREVVHVYNYFHENGTAYIIMEYVDGITLKSYVQSQGGTLTAAETFSILRPIMEALDHVHAVELVHRDISPDNIMLLPRGGAKLLDFGAVREVIDAHVDQPLDRSTEAILKHGYAPMEQYQRRGTLGPWTDIYALCATVYFCLTGEIPPDAPARMMDDLEPDWNSISSLTGEEKQILEKAMSLRAEDRFHRVRDLIGALFHGKTPETDTRVTSAVTSAGSSIPPVQDPPTLKSGIPQVMAQPEEIQKVRTLTHGQKIIPFSQIPEAVEPEEETVYEDETVLDDLTENTEEETRRFGGRGAALLLQPAEQKVFLINKNRTKLGRSNSKCDVVIENNNSVSKVHAELIQSGAEYYLSDARSANGTYLNGQALAPETPVKLSNPAIFQLNEETLVLISGNLLQRVLSMGAAAFLAREDYSALRFIEGDSLPLNRNNKWPDGTLSDSKVHRSAHARILRHNGQFYLADEAPEHGNGTHLNGIQLQHGEVRPLKSGDQIRVGRTNLEFVMISL